MVEIFSSIQGEGMLVGCRQIFLRFHGCNLSCAYCDTRETHKSPAAEYCLVEETPGRRDFSRRSNPVTIQTVQGILNKWVEMSPGVHHSISLTGGEPLLHEAILMEWLPVLHGILPVYLETNGTLHAELSRCIDFLDHVSMDVKLPSTCGAECPWEDHLRFLATAAQKNVFVKIVVSDSTHAWEISKTCELILSVDRNIPLVIQPMTDVAGETAISPSSLVDYQEIAGRCLREVRVIPQTHKFLHLM